jgi:hypothetical protein
VAGGQGPLPAIAGHQAHSTTAFRVNFVAITKGGYVNIERSGGVKNGFAMLHLDLYSINNSYFIYAGYSIDAGCSIDSCYFVDG